MAEINNISEIPESGKKLYKLLFAFIVIFSFFFFMKGLDKTGYWLDEAISVRTSHSSFSDVFSKVSKDKPALYYYLLHFSLKIKENEFFARFPSVIFGTGFIIGIGLFTSVCLKKFKNRNSAVISAMILSVSSAFIYRYAQEARPYMLLTMLHSFILYYSILLIRDKMKSVRDYVIFCILIVLSVHTLHLTFVLLMLILLFFIVEAVIEFAVAKRREIFVSKLKKVRIILVFILIAFITTFIYYRKIKTMNFYDSIFVIEPFSLKAIATYLNAFGIAYTEYEVCKWLPWFIPSIVFFLPFTIIGSISVIRQDRRTGLFLILMLLGMSIIPVIFIRIKETIVCIRHMIISIIPYMALTGLGCSLAGKYIFSKFRKGDSFIFHLIPALLLAAVSFFWIFTHPVKRAEWRDFIKFVKEHKTEDTVIIGLRPGDVYVPAYYAEKEIPGMKVYEVLDNLDALKIVMEKNPHVYLFTVGPLEDKGLLAYLETLQKPERKYYQVLVWHTIPAGEYYSFPDIEEKLLKNFKENSRYDIGSEGFACLGKGWGGPEKNDKFTYRWITSENAEVIFAVENSSGYKIKIKASPFLYENGPGQTMWIIVNDKPAAEFDLKPGDNDYEFTIDKDKIKEGMNILNIRPGYVVKVSDVIKSSADPRTLGISVDYIEFQKVE